MLMRSNRSRTAFWAVLLAAIAFCAIASPAHANTINCQSQYSPAYMIYAYQPNGSDVAVASRGGVPMTTVLVRLDAVGNVVDDFVWRSSGNGVFDSEALTAVRFSRFVPETRDCAGYGGTYLVNVRATPQSQLAYSQITPTPYYAFAPIIVRASCGTAERPAQLTYAYQPEWPEVALAQAVAPATTTVAVTIDANGNLLDESVWRSSGNTLLDNEALKAVRLSSYEPEIHQCVRVAGSYLMDIAFVE